MDKALIEEGSLELLELFDQVSEEARKEKNAIPPINEILYWWTRKPLIVGRAVVLTSTLKDIDTVKQLLGLNKEKRAFNYTPNVEVFREKLGRDPSEIKVFDPFAGAGNLIFEAKRLGLNCTALEYNPVAYLIMKAVLEYPAKYGKKLAEDIEKYGKEVIERTRKEIGSFFERKGRKALTYLWVWCIKCPYCGQRIPLTNHKWIVKTEKKRIGVRFTLTDDFDFCTELIENMSEKEGKEFTQKGGRAICIRCRNSINYEHLTSDIANRRDSELIVVVAQDIKGKNYELPTKEDKRRYEEAIRYLKQIWNDYEAQELIPYEDVRPSHRRENLLWHYGIKQWYQFFNKRQLLVMLTLLKNIKQVSSEISDKERAKLIGTCLAFMLCKHVNSNAIGVVWNTQRETVEHTLLARQPRIYYNYGEINPFERGRGALSNALENIIDAIEFALLNKEGMSEIMLGSALHPPYTNGIDLIITDPPYLDDVQYGEISEFFYVWLYRALKDYYQELPARTPIDEDIVVSWGRFGDLKIAHEFYDKAMKEAFKQLNMALKSDGLLIVFFAHSSTDAWNLLLEVLREARFRVVSSYAVHTESVSNVLARGKTSFTSSIVVACRKILEDSETYFEDLLPRIEDKVGGMLKNLTADRLLRLPITDLLIMAYGKVLEEATQHTVLKSYRADFRPEFETLIKDAREYILKEIVAKLTGRSPNILGSEISFYTVAKVFFKGIIPSDDALKITRAYGLEVNELLRREIAKREKGKIRLLFYDEVDLRLKPEEVDRNNLHQQLIYLEKIADKEGASKIKNIISNYGNFRVQDLREIINLLIKNYRIRLNKKEELNNKERKELKILESIADILSSTPLTRGGTLDYYR